MAESFDLENLLETLETRGRPYYEFLRQESLSAGIYRLAAGEPDRQQPHAEDEVYYVLAGSGLIEVEGTRTAVRPGSVIFVPKQAQHRFLDYSEGLTLLVFFAPAQGS